MQRRHPAALAFAQLDTSEGDDRRRRILDPGRLPLEHRVGTTRRPIDPLTAPLDTITCDC